MNGLFQDKSLESQRRSAIRHRQRFDALWPWPFQLPVNRNIGTVSRPAIWTLYRADTKHFLIQDIAEDDRADFLQNLRQYLGGASTIHLLAHSMGNLALTEALSRIGAATSRRGGTTFNEIVLTAPDIDVDTFVRDIAPAIVPTAKASNALCLVQR